jgi:hypothetical protein
MSNHPNFFEGSDRETGVLIRALFDRSKTIGMKEDAELMYKASLLIGVLDAKVKSLMGNPDDELHG